jgi:hypothetical protein
MRPVSFFILLFFAGNIHAQVGFGPELGVGMSTLRFAPATSPILYTSASVSAILSGRVGGLADIPLNKHTYFQTGLFLSLKGGDRSFSYHTSDSFNESVSQALRFTYVELPLTVVYKSGVQGMGRFIAGLGAVPSYLAGGSYKMKDNGAYGGVPFNADGNGKIVANEAFHGFDINVSITAGYELPTGLFFRAYFLSGVNNLSYGNEITKNRMFGISAGYILGKGRKIKKDAEGLIDITP